ncbi:aberrant root formation protein 4 isoform X3 [Solanum dulcamara]|uniref:aberrant root formation protein 4 isoform X3 n=1 Tax=Solanum dulcamara TaxID=45834 RepID=UPI00248518C9|nr:aberrant root formation protein 4 isoform X3 [Solanum dulcamara]
MKADGLLGIESAIRARTLRSPVEWWMQYGHNVPNLQQFAIRVQSLTCSSSGCERDWSVYEEHIHTKKRNMLELKRLNDLVFIKYNRTLVRHYNARNTIDPILLDNIDDANEWLTGAPQNHEDEEVYEGEGLTYVIILIKRRQFEQVKAAVPVILGVLKSMSLETDEEGKDTEDLFHKAIALADSIQAVCKKLEQKDKKKLCALLGMYVLQVMALVSIAMGHIISSLLPIMIQLSHFLPICGLSYEGLITGLDVDKFTTICGDEGDNSIACFSHVKHGGSLAVIWGYKSNETSVAADADFEAVKNELQKNQSKRWQAIGMLKHVFSSVDLSWELKAHALDFLLCIMDGCVHQEIQNDTMGHSTYMPTLYISLQAIEMVIIYAPNAVLRKKSFDALMKVLADVPSSLRFDILTALIQNSESSSMIAILLDCIRREMHDEYSRSISVTSGVSKSEVKYCQCLSFWSAGVLELVELVLKPPNGGPPSLPEYSDAVLSALNLYRFVVIRESTGKTNCTGVLSKDMLQKAYNEWLLPLRTLVTGVMAENQQDHDQLASDTMCALNPIELVLYRCIELVEDNLKHA